MILLARINLLLGLSSRGKLISLLPFLYPTINVARFVMKSNKKQIISILAVLTMAILLSCAFVACNKVDTDKTGTDIVADYKVTIHPNNGQGDIIWDITKEIPTITKDGYHIAGYFLDAQLTISTTLESLKATGITKNIDVYVKWEEDVCEHVAVTDAAVEPTCTEKGLTEGKHCSKCGKILKAQTEIDALGHDLENHDGQEATCTEKGWKAYVTCKREGCGYTTYNEIPALGHKYSKDWSTDKTYHWHASTCGHDVVSDKGKHTFDSNWVCTECAYVDTGLHGVELRTNTLELNGTDIYGKVSNATSTFSFINEIAIADSATYIVSTDINGSNVIRTKTVSLGIGDNTFYILVENGKDLGLYTVVIRRRPMYSVSFNVNGGTSVSSQTIEEDYLATEPTTERKGYTFDKWDYDFSKPIIKDTSITASWNIITYNVYYDLNVPSDSISQDVDNSMNVTTYTVEDVITFQTPSRKGYRFTGWDKNIKKGTIGDVTVTASWEVIEYDIVYDFGDADSVSKATNNTQNPSKYTIENTITFVEPSRTGYTFIAWDKNIVRGTIDTQIITASWKIVEYDIIYDFGDNNSVSKATNNEHNPSKYTIEDAITVAEPSRKGYTFIAWDKSIASGTIGTQTITASWKIIEYSIIYDFGDTDSVSKATNNAQNPSKYTIEDAITFAEPSRRGYTFIAWDKSIEKGTINTQTITAIWEVINYSITYELNGWENSSQNVDTYTIESGIITLYDAIKGESLFCGWYLDEECKNHIATIDASTMRDYMVYAYTDDSATKGLSIEKGSVKGYSGTLTDVVIPSYYKGNRVTSIGDRAFYNCTGLTSITIPDSVTSIGKETFSNCIDLTNVTIGNGVTSIGDSAFYGCSKLQDLYITDIMAWCNISGLNNLMWYGSSNKRLYINNELVTSITIPDSVTSIGGYAFSFCTGLTSVVIPDSVTSIGERAFRNCTGLTSITIPNSVTSIGVYAFHDCTGLTSITIPDSVTSIGEYAFDGCYKLIEVYNKSALSITAGSYSNGKVACYAKNVYTNEGGSKLTTDENEYVIYTDEYENILVSYRGTERELILPSYITKINQYAFYRCTGLTSVTIPDSVTSISSSAFSGCKGLTSVTIGESVTSIGWGAFSGCSGLTSVTIPNSVTSIGSSSFFGCTGLKSVTIPESVTSIGSSAFRGCSSLESITIPFVGAKAGVTSNDTYQFPFGYIFGTSSYTGSIATRQYYYGSSTSSTTSTTYYIPSSLKFVTVTGGNILYGAFYNCTGLTSVTIGNGVTSIGRSAFEGCTRLTSITIPDSVTSIGECAFSWCTKLTSVTIGNGVTSIGDYAFRGCSGLTSVTIGNGVTSIGDSAFQDCTGLTSINVAEGNTKYHSAGNCLIETASKTLIFGCKTSVIPSDGSVTSIGSYAFKGCTGLTSITIPNSVTNIGDWVFVGCNSLTSITISENVISIGNNAFSGCKGLTSITIPDNVTSIGERALYNCTGLTSVTIGNGVTSIGDSAFSGCSGLTSITIPDSVTNIGRHTFAYCSGLTSVTIGNGVTSIGWAAFMGCNRLTSILVADGNTKYHSSGNCLIETTSKTLILGCNTSVIPSDGSVTSIGDSAFESCTGLTSVTIPDSVTSIGRSAFYNCTGLTSVTIPNSVTSIGYSAFSYCRGLTSVTIGNSVTSLGEYAFNGCTGLTNIKFNGTIAQWNAISKGGSWKYNVPSACKVICTDGTISISEA